MADFTLYLLSVSFFWFHSSFCSFILASYSTTLSSHLILFCFIPSSKIYVLGKKLTTISKLGYIMKLINPVWLCAIFVVHLSMKSLTFEPISFSLSPWLKNSTNKRLVHFSHSFQGLATLDISHKWKIYSQINFLSSNLYSVSSVFSSLPLRMPIF